MLEKSVVKATVEDIKAKNPDAYNEISTAAANAAVEPIKTQLATVEANLTAVKAAAERKDKVYAAAAQLNQFKLGHELANSNKSVEECLMALISVGKAETTIDTGVFQATAPTAAGGAASPEPTNAVTTKEAAIAEAKAENPKGTTGDHIKSARRKYPGLFVGHIGK